MHSHLNNHIARENVNDLIAAAEHERLVRSARNGSSGPGLLTRLAATVRRRQPAPAPAPAPTPAACRTPARP
jgi:hypothetical protein